MSITTSPRPKPEAIPDHPGVYQFKDAAGRVIYVGKAISLRKRLASYFQPLRNLHPRTAAMVESSDTLEWVLVRSEVEALQLEYNLIKQHRPRYNVRYRDDKSYPWLAVTVSEEIPRPRVERGAKRKGTRYFGPYAHAYAIRETLDLLLRTFPMRTCSQGVFDRQRRLGRPCILYDINKCSGPCVGHVTPEAHREIVDEFISFMEGRTRPVLRRLEEEMREAAEQLNFETAARLRDQLASVRKALERQQMVSSAPEDFDIAAFAEDDLEAAVQVFFVRRGRVVGQRGFVVDKVEELDTASLAATFVQQLYGERLDEVPREVLLPVLPEGADALRQWLAGVRGGPVDFRVPQRGEKRALLETVTANARDSFLTHKLKRASDFDARARALKELQEQLDLPVAPLRIECYDISNLQGNQVVGSMVVFEDGLPRKSEYRRFEVRTVDGQDDFASMREVLSRRLARLASEQGDAPAEPVAGAPAEVEPDGLHEPAAGVPGAGRAHRPRGDRPGQADGGGLPARLARPGGAAARQRGAVPAATGPRRGAPLRHRLPPQAARQVDDPQRARRHSRRRRGKAQGPGAPLRLPAEGRAGQRRRDRRPARLRPAPGPDCLGPPPRSVILTQELHTEDRLRASTVDFVVITGLSGAGRSEAAKVLEDLGYFVIDNLPPPLIGRVAELALVGRDRSRVALVVDARGGAFGEDVSELQRALEPLRALTITLRVLFLEASDEVLVRRFEQTRRRHPVAGERVVEAIALERELLRDLRASADLVIDTSDLNVHELRTRILAAFTDEAAGLLVTVASFGFKYGLPLDADMVLDVRFLPNPHWVPALRPKTGQDTAVREYVLQQEGTKAFMDRVEALLEIALPGYVREGKHYLTVAIGCTGGRHRSVVLAEELGRWLAERRFRVNVTHRDMERE